MIATKVKRIIKLPRWDIRLDVHLKDDLNADRLVATLYLDKLDWTTSFKRWTGKIKEVYVMELPPSSTNSVAGAT